MRGGFQRAATYLLRDFEGSICGEVLGGFGKLLEEFWKAFGALERCPEVFGKVLVGFTRCSYVSGCFVNYVPGGAG